MNYQSQLNNLFGFKIPYLDSLPYTYSKFLVIISEGKKLHEKKKQQYRHSTFKELNSIDTFDNYIDLH